MEKEKRVRKYPLASYNYNITEPVYDRRDKSYRQEIIKSETELVYSIHARGRKELEFRTQYLRKIIDESLQDKYTQSPEMCFMKSAEVGDRMVSFKPANNIHALAAVLKRKVSTKRIFGALPKGEDEAESLEMLLITIVE